VQIRPPRWPILLLAVLALSGVQLTSAGCLSKIRNRPEPQYELLLEMTYTTGGDTPVFTGVDFYTNRRMRYVCLGDADWGRLTPAEYDRLEAVLAAPELRDLLSAERLPHHQEPCCDWSGLFLSLERTCDRLNYIHTSRMHWFSVRQGLPEELYELVVLLNEVGDKYYGWKYNEIPLPDDPSS
jgi:hypothetical protein